jgi:hypothetical protein
MGTLKSLVQSNTPNDKKPLPLAYFLSKIEGQPAYLLFTAPTACKLAIPANLSIPFSTKFYLLIPRSLDRTNWIKYCTSSSSGNCFSS